jgi:predicted RNA methylase
MNVDASVVAVLSNAEISGNQVLLSAALDRKLYVATDRVLNAAGGRWSRSHKAHVFDGDPTDILEQVILTGQITSHQDVGFFESPPPIVGRVLELAQIEPGMLVLEPSAGRGNIAVAAANAGAIVHCFELLPRNAELLASRMVPVARGYSVNVGDFLAVSPDTPNFGGNLFDRVVMNPPFSRQADIRHVLHAFRFLRAGGRLVSVMSASVQFRENRLTTDFRKFVSDHKGRIESTPQGSFAVSGTLVNTVIVTLEREISD